MPGNPLARTWNIYVDGSGNALSGQEATILDGSASPSSVMKFESGESNSAVIEGFTIQEWGKGRDPVSP